MDRVAIRAAVSDWLAALAESDAQFEWTGKAELTVEAAFLVDGKTRDGDDYKAGAVRVTVPADRQPVASVRNLRDAVVGDRTLGNRVKRATFEISTDDPESATIVVIPR